MERYNSREVGILQGGEEEPLLEVEEELLLGVEVELLQQEEKECLLAGVAQRDPFSHSSFYTKSQEEQRRDCCVVEVEPRGQPLQVRGRGQLCERLPLLPPIEGPPKLLPCLSNLSCLLFALAAFLVILAVSFFCFHFKPHTRP